MSFPYEYRVAIATKDGKEMAEHFGSAPVFLVYTFRGGRIVDLELRENRRRCARDAESNEGCWRIMEELLPDVKVVISHGMGENAYVGLLRRDVLPINTDERDADRAIHGYVNKSLRDDPRLIHHSLRSASVGTG
jgi:predicted Fe-Mo cluster-binding NifX family protein